jgi:Ca2+-transporting ATPase
LFAHGGLKVTLFYGTLIALLTLFAFISIPCAELARVGANVNFNSIKDLLNSDSNVLMKAQTFAFATLAVSELFHAIGMRNLKKSFIRKEFFNNKLMIVAVAAGVLLQVLVTEISFLNDFFKTTKLELTEWFFILGISLVTLLVHEVVVLIIKLKNRKK